jgi:hypothetical protein
MAHSARILVASNRGPVSYTVEADGTLTSRRGGGGLVSGLSAIGPDAGALWVCAALSDGDREAVRQGRSEPGSRMIAVPPDVFHAAYNDIANSVLWFVHHMLYQTPLEPSFGEGFRGHWASYQEYNTAFADALAEGADEGAAVLVQDDAERVRALATCTDLSRHQGASWTDAPMPAIAPFADCGQASAAAPAATSAPAEIPAARATISSEERVRRQNAMIPPSSTAKGRISIAS